MEDLDALTKLLLSPILAPIQGLAWIAQKLVEQAESELYNEDAVRNKLAELELRLGMGEISEEEYTEAEEFLMGQIRMIRERQAEKSEEG